VVSGLEGVHEMERDAGGDALDQRDSYVLCYIIESGLKRSLVVWLAAGNGKSVLL
jgi:hypothetical protein